MIIKKSKIGLAIYIMILSVTSDLRSAEIDGVYFNDEYSAGGNDR